jgi:UrcA family protein
MSRIFKSAITALALAAALAPAALAEVSVEQVSARVRYADLDMSRPDAGQDLLKRIERAARKVCADAIPRSPLMTRAVNACRAETVANVVRGLEISALTVAWSGSRTSVLASR